MNISNKQIYPNNKNFELKYTIEFTQNKKVFEEIGTAKFTHNKLNRKEYDNLNDAIYSFNSLYYNNTVLHCMLFSELIIDGITVQEDCISIMPILDTKSYYQVEQTNEALNSEVSDRTIFLNHYNISEQEYRKQVEKYKEVI